MHLAHGVRISHVARPAIFRAPGIAIRQRVDQSLFAWRSIGLERDGLLNRFQRFRLAGRIHGRVDVRSQRQRLAPVGHRQVRIEPRGFTVSAPCLGMIERVGKVQSLIHEELRLLVFR